METQTGVFEAIKALLYVKPIFLLGLLLIIGVLYGILKKNKRLPKKRTAAGTLLLFYYLYIVFSHIVGIPTLQDFLRRFSLGDPFFCPNISLTLLPNGVTLEFLLNIFCFIPLGFLGPFTSRAYERFRNTALLGFGVSLAIEISQLFTLFRATDINDLIANSLGTIIGFLIFKVIAGTGVFRPSDDRASSGHMSSAKVDSARLLPIFTVLLAFLCTFLFEF